MGPWVGSRGREISKEDTKARHPSHWGDGKFAGVAGTHISLIEPNIDPN